ncbi:MAG: YggS family pyridoxal phosphate-dependent enzyme [Thermodesulfobacteriota bacterium]
MMKALTLRIKRVQDRIQSACVRAGRDPLEVTLLAVTKTVSVEGVQEAIAEGLIRFGENYVQEAQIKIEALHQGIWHFIGHLQKNKAKQAVRIFSMIETVDSTALARELNRQALALGKVTEVLIQINEAGEQSKSGLQPAEVPPLLEESPGWPGLRIRGLMTIPPYDPDPEGSRTWYRSLYKLREKWQKEFTSLDLAHLSMGMSHDFETAIEEGATIIRVGTAIFGQRK